MTLKYWASLGLVVVISPSGFRLLIIVTVAELGVTLMTPMSANMRPAILSASEESMVLSVVFVVAI